MKKKFQMNRLLKNNSKIYHIFAIITVEWQNRKAEKLKSIQVLLEKYKVEL